MFPEQAMIVNQPPGQRWQRRTTALMVLNPRRIPDCIEAITGLGVDTCWVTNMPETDAAAAINAQILETSYDRYVVISDDCAPTRYALDAVLALHDQGYDAVTGYCNLDAELPHCNLTTNRLPKPPPTTDSYKFLTTREAQAHEGPIPTTFAGLALTCMARHMWLAYPLRTTVLGGQMDFDLSYRLALARIRIVAPPDGFVHHAKEHWNRYDQASEKRLLVGVEPQSVTWTKAPVPAVIRAAA